MVPHSRKDTPAPNLSQAIDFGMEEPKGSGWASAHAPVNKWIKIRNRVFKRLNGYAPYYAQVPNSELIIAFQDVETSMRMLVIDRTGRLISHVDEGMSGIGYDLNSNGHDKDVITAFDGRILTIKSYRSSFYKTVLVDINTGTVISNVQADYGQ